MSQHDCHAPDAQRIDCLQGDIGVLPAAEPDDNARRALLVAQIPCELAHGRYISVLINAVVHDT